MPNDIILITPGGGYQQMDSAEVNSTLDAVASGGTLSSSQQTIANSLKGAAASQGNVFAGGSPAAAGTVQPVIRGTTPAPATVGATSKNIQSFLTGLTPGQTGTAVGSQLPLSPQQKIAVSGSPLGGMSTQNLQSLLFPNLNASPGNDGQQVGNMATFGDPALIEEVENLRLKTERAQLVDSQVLRERRLATQGRGALLSSLQLNPRSNPAAGKTTYSFSERRGSPIGAFNPQRIIG